MEEYRMFPWWYSAANSNHWYNSLCYYRLNWTTLDGHFFFTLIIMLIIKVMMKVIMMMITIIMMISNGNCLNAASYCLLIGHALGFFFFHTNFTEKCFISHQLFTVRKVHVRGSFFTEADKRLCSTLALVQWKRSVLFDLLLSHAWRISRKAERLQRKPDYV